MPTPNKSAGRPTTFKPEYVEQAYNYCLLGAIDTQMAEFFKVSEKTINAWKKSQPEFADALRRGKTMADAQVAGSLFKRATGYSHPETHINCYEGEIIQTEVTKHYPPDTTACIFWLKNRQSDKWRDKVELAATHKLDKEMLDSLKNEMSVRMAKARDRQKQVLIERGIIDADGNDVDRMP